MEGKGKEIALRSNSIDETSVESRKYYMARRTTTEMLRNRGYVVSDEDIYLTLVVDRLSISAQHRSDSSKKACSNSRNSEWDRGIPVKCVCGRGVLKLTSGTQDNPGRPFYRCKSMEDEHLFKWVEETMLEEIEDAIQQLRVQESEFSTMRTELGVLKDAVNDLKEDCMAMKDELKRSKDMTKWLLVSVGVMSLVVAFKI